MNLPCTNTLYDINPLSSKVPCFKFIWTRLIILHLRFIPKKIKILLLLLLLLLSLPWKPICFASLQIFNCSKYTLNFPLERFRQCKVSAYQDHTKTLVGTVFIYLKEINFHEDQFS